MLAVQMATHGGGEVNRLAEVLRPLEASRRGEVRKQRDLDFR